MSRTRSTTPRSGRVVDLAGQVLEEAVELVDRAVGGRQELGRVERARLDPAQRRDLGREVAAEALDLAADLDRVAALEARAEHVDVAEDPGRDRAGPVPQLEAQVGRAVLRLLPVLANHREAPREGSARLQRRDPLGGRSGCGIGGGLIDARSCNPRRTHHPGRRPSRRGTGGATVDAMDPIIWEREPPELRSPVLVASFSGWNDAASAAGTALGADRRLARDRAGRPDRSRGVLRLPGEPADDRDLRRDDAGRRVARQPDRRRHGRGSRARPAADQRHRAEHPLAHLLQRRPRRRRGMRRRVGRHLRLADRRRRPHPPGADHRPGDRRRDDRAARLRGRRLRGPDRDPRHLPRRLPRARHRPPPASGPPSPTTPPPSRTRRPAWRCCAGSRG